MCTTLEKDKLNTGYPLTLLKLPLNLDEVRTFSAEIKEEKKKELYIHL